MGRSQYLVDRIIFSSSGGQRKKTCGLSRMGDTLPLLFLTELGKKYRDRIYLTVKPGGAPPKYIKQEVRDGKLQKRLGLNTEVKILPPTTDTLVINLDGSTTPPIFLQFSDTEDYWYTKQPITIQGGQLYFDQEVEYVKPVGVVLVNPTLPIPAAPAVQTAPVVKNTYTTRNGEPVSATTVKGARNALFSQRTGSGATAEIFRQVLAQPLPWQPNEWIELGEEVRMANGEPILKDGKPFIEFWYINPITNESKYVLPEGNKIRDLAVSSSIGQELEKLRNTLSLRETAAVQDATLTMASRINSAKTLEDAKALAKEDVKQSYVPKYSTHPQIKEAYEQLARPSANTPRGNSDPALEKYVKMKKMGVPPPAIMLKVNADSGLTAEQKATILSRLQAGGQRGGLPPAPGGLGAALAGRLPLRSGPPGPPGPASASPTKLNDAGMEQLKDLVETIKRTPAYDSIDPANVHPLFICTNGICSVDQKFKDSVLQTVVVKAQAPMCAVSAAGATGTTKLTVKDFIEMKDIMDRPSLIAFMKSTYSQNEKQFNVDIQEVFSTVTADEIQAAVAQYAERKVVKPKAQSTPVSTSESPKAKALTPAQLKANEQKRKEAANVVRPFEHYTVREETLLNDIENRKQSIKELETTLEGNKKALTEAAKKGLVQPRHVRAILDTQAQLKQSKKELNEKENTPGLKEKSAFMASVSPQILRTDSFLVETGTKGREILWGEKKLPAGWKVTLDPVARTAVYSNGSIQMPPEGKTLPEGWKIVVDNGALVYKDSTGAIQTLPSGGRRHTRKERGTRRKGTKNAKGAKGTRGAKGTKKYRR